jgi:hypothetical protein
VAAFPRLTLSHTYASPSWSPTPSQGLLPACGSALWPDGIRARWRDTPIFRTCRLDRMRCARAVGCGGLSRRFRRDLSPSPIAHTVPQGSVVIPVGPISQGPVGEHDMSRWPFPNGRRPKCSLTYTHHSFRFDTPLGTYCSVQLQSGSSPAPVRL